MIRHYAPLLPKTVSTYIEPFMGGGAMFDHVMTTYQPRLCLLSDANEDVMNIYKQVQSAPREVIGAMQLAAEFFLSKPTLEERKENYYELREYHSLSTHGPQSAGHLLLLFKLCFNGFYQENHNTNERFGTPAGACNQERLEQLVDEDNIWRWHRMLNTGSVGLTSLRVTNIMFHNIPDDGFVFLDPPYRGDRLSLKKGYHRGWDDSALKSLIRQAAQVPDRSRVMLCNRDLGDGFYDAHGMGLKQWRYARRSVIGKGKASNDLVEIVLHNGEG